MIREANNTLEKSEIKRLETIICEEKKKENPSKRVIEKNMFYLDRAKLNMLSSERNILARQV